MDAVEGIEKPAKTLKPRKRFVGSSAKAPSSKAPIRRVANQVPDDILQDVQLNEAIKGECSDSNVMLSAILASLLSSDSM
jgi:hypothetical protein